MSETKVGDQLKLDSNEVMAIGLGLTMLMENFDDIKKNSAIPWTPEARQIQKDIYQTAKSAAEKIEQITGFECRLDAYVDGDEDEFLTKQS